MDDDGSPLSWFGLGNVKDKLDSFCSDVDRIIFQDAENLLLSAGTSVKQFCEEFMEEMLPESIVKTLKEKNSAPPLKPSNDTSPFPMEMVENESTDSSLGVENDVVKEPSLEEIRIRETASLTSNVSDHHNLPQIPSSRTVEEQKSSNPVEKLMADIEAEFSTMEISSSTLHVFYDVKKELLDGSNVTTEFNTQVVENQDPSFGDDVCKENIDLNDGSDERKVEEIGATHVTKADAEVQSFRSETSDDKCIMMDSSKLCPIPDLHEENPTLQGSLCTNSGDESDCEKAATRSVAREAEIDGFGGNSIWLLPSEHADQSSSETDWVMV